MSKRREAVEAAMSARSVGHAGFYGTRVKKIGKEKQTVTGRIDGDPEDGDVEYFVGPTGLEVYVADVTKPIALVELWPKAKNEAARKALVRIDAVRLNVSGVDGVIEFMRQRRLPIPRETRAVADRYQAKFDAARRVADERKGIRRSEPGLQQGSPGDGKSRAELMNMKNRSKDGKSIAECWSEHFIENEKLAKSGKALTDAQLVAKMRAQFVDKKGSQSIERCDIARREYNGGKYKFEKLGPAGKPGRPISNKYEDGKTPVTESDKKEKKAAKPAEKKAEAHAAPAAKKKIKVKAKKATAEPSKPAQPTA